MTSQIHLFKIMIVGPLPWGSGGHDKSKNPVNNHGYPLLGCSSAEPNSVSPGNMKDNLHNAWASSKPAKRAHRLRATNQPAKSA